MDAARLYSGRWYEIGRIPLSLTGGCVAGYTDYQRSGDGLYERDACRNMTPDGEVKAIGGRLNIINLGQNSKVHVTYHAIWSLIPINRDYWMIYHTDDWLIEATPDMSFVDLLHARANPSQDLVDKMTKEVRDTGYAG